MTSTFNKRPDYKYWTASEVKLLKELLAKGTNWEELIYIFQRNKKSIKNKIERLCLSTRGLTK